MVHLISTDSDRAQLTSAVQDCIAGGDLDAYLSALVLATGFHDWRTSPWSDAIRALVSAPYDSTSRPQDVAIAGVRLFFGSGVQTTEFAALVERELARKPLPPAVTVREDDRILVGIAAGVTASAPGCRGSIREIARTHTASVRSRVLRLWADVLCDGGSTFSAPQIGAAAKIVVEAVPASHDDRAALLWLIGRLLDSSWTPDDEVLARVDTVAEDLRRGLAGVDTAALLPLSVAMLVDAASVVAPERLVRASTLGHVLAVLDQFSASAAVLATRPAQRPPFVVENELDVQDLFRALVLPIIPDCEPEDPAPKHAGKFSRLDFVSKRARMGFEMKFVRNSRHADAVREEILLDEATYHSHPYVHQVVALIYDPHRFIAPAARHVLERDLSTSVTIDGRTVVYHVRVRG